MSRIRSLALLFFLVVWTLPTRAGLTMSDESRLQGLLGKWKVTAASGKAVDAGKTALSVTNVSSGVVHLTWTYFQGAYQTQSLIRCDTKTRTMQLLELSRDGSVKISPGEFDRTNNLVFTVQRNNAPARLTLTWTGDTLTAQESFDDDGGRLQTRYMVKLVREEP